ncbi:hypothetical protein PanWU01x14_153930 [Parasponia andersonii]|uniref:Uncharacterized protein n=1 Tax=Parasponia andersonii TaxID=3476 RepID=A0A2P5CH89_PARAD|nr:hypothetical protein PanWU01x14_153930 [Parasponia andersonii]
MNYYSIHFGQILIFIYQGSSEFSVRICEGIGSEIVYSSHGPTSGHGEPNLDKSTQNHHTNNEDQSVENFDSESQFSSGSSDKHEEHTSDDDSIEILDVKSPTSHRPSKSQAFNIGRVERKSLEKGQNISSPRKRGRLRTQGRSATSMAEVDKHKEHTTDEDSVTILNTNPRTICGSSKSKAFNNIGHFEQKYFGRVHEVGVSSKSNAFHTIGHVDRKSYGKGQPVYFPRKMGRPRKQERSAAPTNSPSPVSVKRSKP